MGWGSSFENDSDDDTSDVGSKNTHPVHPDRCKFTALSDADALASYKTNHDLPDFVEQHGPLLHNAERTAYDIFFIALFSRAFRFLGVGNTPLCSK